MTPDLQGRLTGKVMQKSVLVTGCSSGIGLESALDLKRQGFNVLAACRKADDVARMQELG
jgi:NAD(P)-dependent dehydrogenase (short-subunit alcohol dehydrogenase family)